GRFVANPVQNPGNSFFGRWNRGLFRVRPPHESNECGELFITDQELERDFNSGQYTTIRVQAEEKADYLTERLNVKELPSEIVLKPKGFSSIRIVDSVTSSGIRGARLRLAFFLILQHPNSLMIFTDINGIFDLPIVKGYSIHFITETGKYDQFLGWYEEDFGLQHEGSSNRVQDLPKNIDGLYRIELRPRSGPEDRIKTRLEVTVLNEINLPVEGANVCFGYRWGSCWVGSATKSDRHA
ncbi:MAG: hypothetical protein KJ645_09470, partial [Planctomycetes bacterium]|nr:hypothetical protein [Planctomycetota bacterium]